MGDVTFLSILCRLPLGLWFDGNDGRQCCVVFGRNRQGLGVRGIVKITLKNTKKLQICQNTIFAGQLNTPLALLMAIFYSRLLILDYSIKKHWKEPFQLLWKHTLEKKKKAFFLLLSWKIYGIISERWWEIRGLVQQMEESLQTELCSVRRIYCSIKLRAMQSKIVAFNDFLFCGST